MRSHALSLSFVLVLGFLLLGCDVSLAQKRFDGVHINLVTQAEAIVHNLYRHKDEFEETTGATVSIVGTGNDDLFDQVMGDLQDGSTLYDGFVISPLFMVDFVQCIGCPKSPGLEVLTDRVRDSEVLAWHDVFPYFRSHNSVYDGDVYTITMDGDAHYMFYNIDVLEELGRDVPNTWEEFAEIAELAHGRDWNGDGIPDYGTCIPRTESGQIQFFLFSVVSSFMQSHGTSQGIYFDPDTFEPLLDTPGFREGLSMYTRLREFGPEEHVGIAEMFNMVAEGKCAITVAWADIGAQSRDTRGTNYSTWDQIGAGLPPGTKRVWDYRTNTWNDCEQEPELCPFADGDNVNHAPFAAHGGWSAAIAANIPDERKDATFEFFSLLGGNSNIDVLSGTGFEPYRNSHFNLSLWVETGFNERAAERQIAGMLETLKSQNLVVDLRIPGSNAYVNDGMEGELFRLNNGEISEDEFIKRVTATWEGLTDQIGRRDQIQQYRATIGLPPKDFAEEVEVTEAGRIAFAVVAGVFALMCILLIFFVYFHSNLKVWRYASPSFLYASLIGAIIAYTGIMLMSAYPSTGTCTSALWLYVVGMAMILGNIFAKTYRTWQLFRHQKKFFIAKMRDIDLLPISFAVVFCAIIILAVWTGMDAPTAHESTLGVDDLEYVVICDSTEHGAAFFGTTIAYFGILLLVALVLSFNTRHAGEAFNESKVLGLCVYNLTQVVIIVVVCALALDDPDARYVLVVMCLMFGVTVTIGLLFIPKVYATLRGKGEEVSTATSAGNSVNTYEMGTEMDH